jgi:hypothetical protein
VQTHHDLFDKISLYVEASKTYGPYARPDGRKIVIIINDDGSRRTVSWPKRIMEQHLGRQLHPDNETVDHIDGNFDNNKIDNLRVVPRAEHSGDDTRRVKMLKMKCVYCDKDFERSPRLVRDKSSKGKHSSFCSRECAGKYSREVQLGKREKLPPLPPPASEYYKRKNLAASMEHLISKYGD